MNDGEPDEYKTHTVNVFDRSTSFFFQTSRGPAPFLSLFCTTICSISSSHSAVTGNKGRGDSWNEGVILIFAFDDDDEDDQR